MLFWGTKRGFCDIAHVTEHVHSTSNEVRDFQNVLYGHVLGLITSMSITLEQNLYAHLVAHILMHIIACFG